MPTRRSFVVKQDAPKQLPISLLSPPQRKLERGGHSRTPIRGADRHDRLGRSEFRATRTLTTESKYWGFAIERSATVQSVARRNRE